MDEYLANFFLSENSSSSIPQHSVLKLKELLVTFEDTIIAVVTNVLNEKYPRMIMKGLFQYLTVDCRLL